MDKTIFERLNQFCEIPGLSKTTAIERTVNFYIDDYEAMMRKVDKEHR